MNEFNSFPPGWRKISEKEFAQSDFFRYGIGKTEYRQMMTENKSDPAIGATLYYIDADNGFSIVNNFWNGTIEFYAFGCDHDWSGDPREELEKRNIVLYGSEHASLCAKCGKLQIVDSSD